MKKRGQVTVFIIIALILLILGGILVYTHKKNTEIKPTTLHHELMPVSNLIGSCLASEAGDAVKILGMQSGYLYIPDNIKNNPGRYLKFAGFTLPYWYYDSESHMPDKSFIEKQISAYVDKNINKCLNNFSSLKMFDVKVLGKPEVETKINDNNLVIILKYPLEITSEKSETKADMFSATLNVRLGRVLKLAREIMASENNQAWLEQKTIDIMASSDKIPFTSLIFSCTPKIWKVDKIENLTKHMLYANLPLIRVAHTDYRRFEKPLKDYEHPSSQPPSDMYEYSMFFWKNGVHDDFSDMRVGFTYMPEWNMLFRVTPSAGNIMKSEHINPGSSNIVNLARYCLQFYHFVYDVKYPVMVSIYDDKSFTKGYMFNFAFPVTVVGNWGIRNSRMPLQASAPETEEFCSDTGDKNYMVWVRDNSTYKDIPEASVKFSCIKYECSLGKTDSSGKLSFKLPKACKNGLIVIDKKGYLETIKQVRQDSIPVEMQPLYRVSYIIRKYDNTTKQYYDVGSDEKAVLYMKSRNHVVYDVYGENNTIELTSGNYSVEIYLYKDNKLEGGYSGIAEVPEQATSAVFNAFVWPGKKQEDIYNLITSNYNSSIIKPVIR